MQIQNLISQNSSPLAQSDRAKDTIRYEKDPLPSQAAVIARACQVGLDRGLRLHYSVHLGTEF
jgi:hypothetical protein